MNHRSSTFFIKSPVGIGKNVTLTVRFKINTLQVRQVSPAKTKLTSRSEPHIQGGLKKS